MKWNDAARDHRGHRYEFLDLDVREDVPGEGCTLTPRDDSFGGDPIDPDDIAPFVEFALSGKPIVEKSVDLALSTAVDRFQDIRHVFDLPSVRATGRDRTNVVDRLNFGEYQLFKYPNERRAALFAPVVINLTIEESVTVEWDDLLAQLRRDDEAARLGELDDSDVILVRPQRSQIRSTIIFAVHR